MSPSPHAQPPFTARDPERPLTSAMAAYCEHCGARLAPDARFCEDCGLAVPNAEPAVPPVDEPTPPPAEPSAVEGPTPPSTSPHTAPPRRGHRPVLIGLFALAVLLFVGVLWTQGAGDDPEGFPEPVTLGLVERYKDAVRTMHADHAAAVLANDERAMRVEGMILKGGIARLGQVLHAYYVDEGHGTLKDAQNDMAAFLRSLNAQGLSMSDEAVREGIAQVNPAR